MSIATLYAEYPTAFSCQRAVILPGNPWPKRCHVPDSVLGTTHLGIYLKNHLAPTHW